MIGARAFLRSAVLGTFVCLSAPVGSEASPTTIFEPVSTSGQQVQQLAQFVLWITGGIFFGVSALLSAVLAFSGRVLYPSYAVAERVYPISSLKDQILAGSEMWVFNSIVFLVPAAALVVKLLAPRRLACGGQRGARVWPF